MNISLSASTDNIKGCVEELESMKIFAEDELNGFTAYQFISQHAIKN